MKKHFSVLLGILVSLSSLFISCGDKDEDLQPTICKITVQSSGDGEGTVSITNYIGTSVNALIGNKVEVVATPAVGSAFIGWYVSGSNTPISTDAKFVFIASKNITLIARFAKLSNLTLRSAGNGRVCFKGTNETSLAVLPGSEVTVVATPDEDCDFVGWFIGESDVPVSTDTEYTFTVTENVTLTAKFSKRPVVTLRSTGNGRVCFKGTNETSLAVLPGSEVTVVAAPDEDCDFVGWFIGESDVPVSTDTEYTFTVTENVTLTAKFSKRPVVTLHSTGNGRVCFKGTNETSLAVLPGSEVAVVATPDENCDFVGWFIGESDAPVSTDTEYTFTVTEDITLIAQFRMPVGAVDLGLPSGLKWANMNVGASSPEGYGNYYAWGETTTKSNYTEGSYQYHNGSSYINIGSNISGTRYDVARSQWGGNWRLPTAAEMQELKDRCTWTWTTYQGVPGYKVTGPNGNSIFLPAAGCRYGTEIYDRGSYGYYWSGTLYESYFSCYAYFLSFYSSDHYVFSYYREYGHTVRPVSE